MALCWSSPYARLPAVAPFAYRAVGVVLFELTERRIMLFLFPNLFENWWPTQLQGSPEYRSR